MSWKNYPRYLRQHQLIFEFHFPSIFLKSPHLLIAEPLDSVTLSVIRVVRHCLELSSVQPVPLCVGMGWTFSVSRGIALIWFLL